MGIGADMLTDEFQLAICQQWLAMFRSPDGVNLDFYTRHEVLYACLSPGLKSGVEDIW